MSHPEHIAVAEVRGRITALQGQRAALVQRVARLRREFAEAERCMVGVDAGIATLRALLPAGGDE